MSYTDSSVANGGDSQAGQVKGMEPHKERCPYPPGGELSVKIKTSPRKELMLRIPASEK